MISARALESKRENISSKSSSSVTGLSLQTNRTLSGAVMSAEGRSPSISSTTARLLSSFWRRTSSRSSAVIPSSSSARATSAAIRRSTHSSGGRSHDGDAIASLGADVDADEESSSIAFLGSPSTTPRAASTSSNPSGSSNGSSSMWHRTIRTSA